MTRMPRVGVSVINLSQESVLELFRVREALEGMAARLAAERITDDEVQELHDLLEQHGGHADVASNASYYQASNDDDFHFRIVRSARNEQLEAMLLTELYYKLKLYRYRISSNPGRAQKALEEHREIVKAIASRNPDASEAAMRRHIRNAITAATKQLEATSQNDRR